MMRVVTDNQYQTSKAALAVYSEHCKPYIQKNGWTVIPADAPRAIFQGQALDTETVNAHSTNVELFELSHEKPAKFSAYVTDEKVTTWTGEKIGFVNYTGRWHRNNRGYGKWRAISIRSDWGDVYNGRESSEQQLVNFRKAK
jgi:hypothetical protein